MKIKHNDLFIDKDNPFENCKLNREQYAEVLTQIVETYKDGFVLAVNNEWGTGKTTFIKMWQVYLEKKEFQTIYFNAWENDFEVNPLVAIMAEFSKLKGKNNEIFKPVIENAAILMKNILPALIKSLLKPHIDAEILLEGIENATKGVTEILEDEIKNYNEKKDSIIEFRNTLSSFIKKTCKGKPLVFFIDELDRCRPNYAVEVLEQVKHLFSVEGIVFVLSIDKAHLASSIKGFYGSESINTDEYLRRFIDLEYSIPEPSRKDFIKYMYEYFRFDEFYNSWIQVTNATLSLNNNLSITNIGFSN